MKKTTLCYIENNGKWLMLYRDRKPGDMNKGKWLGIGGKIEDGETADSCVAREVLEETGLILKSFRFMGIVKFRADSYEDEDMYLYTSSDFVPADETAAKHFDETGEYEPPECDEGRLEWIARDELLELPMWEGDKAFIEEILAGAEKISMTLSYEGENCTVIKDPVSMAERIKQDTRIYDVLAKETKVFSQHRWIDDSDDPVIKPVSSNTLSGMEGVIPAPNRKTRIADMSEAAVTRRVTVADLERKLLMQEEAEAARQAAAQQEESSGSVPGMAEKLGAFASGARSAAASLKNVKVADSARFSRFLKIIAVFAVLLVIELGYLRFTAHVANMPKQIKETQKELELTKNETELLTEEIDALGDYDSAEELKQSWQRLKEKVEKAAEETYY